MAALDDNALVKMKTLRVALAGVMAAMPRPGPGLGKRIGKDGEVWGVAPNDHPFRVASNGAISPGLVGGLMPTLDGDPLDDTSNLLDLTIDGPVWFKLSFTIAFTETYLSSWTLDTVEVEQGAALPADTDDEKYVQFNIIGNGQPVASFFTASLSLVLADDGPNATALHLL